MTSSHRVGAERAGPAGMGFAEFVVLMALTTSIVALSIDVMLPALPEIGRDLSAATENDRQLVVTAFFLGLSISPLVFGVAGDAFGRKPVVFVGLGLFILGCAVSAFATSFAAMLVGRVIQGVGAAAPRVLSVAIIRDRYEGRAMAQVLSLVMAVFIFVPVVAPTLGLGMLRLAEWRAIFLILLGLAGLILFWMALRLPETLAPGNRRPVSLSGVWHGVKATLSQRFVLGHVLATGFVFGAFTAYLSSAQQVLGEAYGLGDAFAPVFGALALAIGAAGLLNARLVMSIGMRRLSDRALVGLMAVSAVYLVADTVLGAPPLWGFLAWCAPAFFCVGGLFANLNALAMEPLGRLAGTGAAVIQSISNFMGAGIGMLIARSYDGSAAPIVLGFALCGATAMICAGWARTGAREARP